MICPREDTRAELLLFPSQVLTRSGSADPELTVSARAHALGTPTRKTQYCPDGAAHTWNNAEWNPFH